MNIGDIIVLTVLSVSLVIAVFHLIKKRKRSKHFGCCNGCTACSLGTCKKKEKG